MKKKIMNIIIACCFLALHGILLLPLADAAVCTWGEWQIATQPSCETDGLRYRICDANDYPHRQEEVLLKTGHTFRVFKQQKASCTQEGKTIYTCTACGAKKEDGRQEKLAHTYKTSSTPASCTHAGSQTKTTCSNCGDTQTVHIAKLAHTFQTEIVREPNCKQEGISRQRCTQCGSSEDERLPITAHTYETEQTHPSCTREGLSIHTCTVCAKQYQTVYAAKLAHSYVTHIETNEAKTQQTVTYTCSICAHRYAETIALKKKGIMNMENIVLSTVNLGLLAAITLNLYSDLYVIRWHKKRKQRKQLAA